MSRAGAVGAVASAVLAGQDAGAVLRIGTVIAVDAPTGEVQLDIFEDGWLPVDRDLWLRVGDRVYALMQGPVGVVVGALGREQGPRSWTTVVAREVFTGEGGEPDTTSAAGKKWPTIPVDLSVWVPEWAISAAYHAEWLGVYFDGNQQAGHVWIALGPVNHAKVRYDGAAGTGPYRATLGTSGTLAVPADMRGTWQVVTPRGQGDTGSAFYPGMDAGSAFAATFTFAG